jgi:predicted DNA-binding transcriptional regulator YafY
MIFKQLNRLQQIDQLIRQKRTGNATNLAAKLGISRRQAYNWLDELRDLGLEIEYIRDIESYVYTKPCKLDITFKVVELSEKEASYINAGIHFLKKNALGSLSMQTWSAYTTAN